MHAGVFGARISEVIKVLDDLARLLQEAFQILLDVLETNFAALTLPEETFKPREKNRVNNDKNLIISRRRFQSPTSLNRVAFQQNFNLKISRIIQNPENQEIREVFEIVFPVYQNPWPKQTFVMNSRKSMEDGEEPMEIGESSSELFCSARSSVFPVSSIGNEVGDNDDVIITADLRPKKCLIEYRSPEISDVKTENSKITDQDRMKLTNILQERKRGIPASVHGSGISDNNSEVQNRKSRLRNLVKREDNRSKNQEKTTVFYFWQMLFFILFPIAVLVASVSITREELDSDDCAHRFNATPAIQDLKNRVYGQTQAIENLADHLDVNTSAFKVLIFIGGTGVGKSYAAHIISENFPIKRNVFQYAPPLKIRRKFALGVVSICGCNLIILENLSNKDISEGANFVEHLARKIINNDNYCLFIIQVINVQRTDDNLRHEVNLEKSRQEIDNIYRDKNLKAQIIQFEPLDDVVIRECILDVAESRNLILSTMQIEDIKNSLKTANSGCKGARAKVQLLDKKLI